MRLETGQLTVLDRCSAKDTQQWGRVGYLDKCSYVWHDSAAICGEKTYRVVYVGAVCSCTKPCHLILHSFASVAQGQNKSYEPKFQYDKFDKVNTAIPLDQTLRVSPVG